jgi:anhydro-N-acetylmuramic acid kinase
MIYRAIGLMSGSSLDGLDLAYVSFLEQGGKWSFTIEAAATIPYEKDWLDQLKSATELSARDYHLLDANYGHYLGKKVNEFIDQYNLQFKVGLVASHGHTTFHMPTKGMTAQIGDGAAIAAETQLPVVSDLRALDVALGGQGAPIVPIGEKLLFQGYQFFLNIGGIANISIQGDAYKAFDICPANRVLNLLAGDAGKTFDEDGLLAKAGIVNEQLLKQLNELEYYNQPFPKSLANEYGTDIVYPLLKSSGLSTQDLLATYCHHIALQIKNSIVSANIEINKDAKILVTGGGALNQFLVQQIAEALKEIGAELIVPEKQLIEYKEALIMAFIGVLRWRQEHNVLASVTGASRNSIGGALWNGESA